MSIEVDRRKIRQLLPYGSGITIAKRVGVTEVAVTSWFSGKTNSHRIESAALKLLSKLSRERELRMKKAGLL